MPGAAGQRQNGLQRTIKKIFVEMKIFLFLSLGSSSTGVCICHDSSNAQFKFNLLYVNYTLLKAAPTKTLTAAW